MPAASIAIASIQSWVEIADNTIAAVATDDPKIMARRSPKRCTTDAAGMSKSSVPSMTMPAIKPAVGRSAPSFSAVAGRIGNKEASPDANSSEGTKMGSTTLAIEKRVGAEEFTVPLSVIAENYRTAPRGEADKLDTKWLILT